MVYNKSGKHNCKVTLSGGDGGKKHQSTGVLTAEGKGFKLLYSIDGDECVLTYDGLTLTQKRAGAFQTEIVFSEGRQTECSFCEGGLTGKLPVNCKRLDVICGKLGVNIKINYDCGGQNIYLNLTAAKFTEKK